VDEVPKSASGKILRKIMREWAKKDVPELEKRVKAKHKWLAGGVAFVDEVPKSASGKILRKIMREWAKKDVPELEKRVKARL